MLTDFDKAAHLWRRAGFGATAREIHETAERGMDRAIDDFLDLDREDHDLEQSVAQFAADSLDLNNNIEHVRHWWLYRMLRAERPLREKLTLFWHGHFATSNAKVEKPSAMLEQNRTLRRLADAPFQQLLESMSKDPAMLAWLDGNSNRKGKPNENFARELMELFSLGIGNYTEKDIQEAARCFTGWGAGDAGFRFDKNQHDAGEKNFFDRKGNLDGKDVIDAIVTHPAAPKFLAWKLCKFFVNDQPAPAYVERVAEAYRRSNGHLRAMVEALFRDPEFFAEENVRAIVKSPAEFVVSACRALGVRIPIQNITNPMRRMGQALLAPPSVKGWDGGAAWLSSSALFERANFALFVTSTRGMPEEPRFDPAIWARGQKFESHADVVNAMALDILHMKPTRPTQTALVDYLLPEKTAEKQQAKGAEAMDKSMAKTGMEAGGDHHEPPNFVFDPKAMDAKLRGLARLLLSSPEFQLS